ncbi:sensor histidine kinase (plasmid) [Streptomyces sp. CA-294286]|uniref:sensor histidine kinase n=1 Tax=Streptomyces sp. CA-294286 TaxID=3240070 RepID=UPI003D8B2393
MRTANGAADDGPPVRSGLLYLGVQLALFTVAVALAPAASIALVMILPQTYWTLRTLLATAAVVVFALVPLFAEAFRTGATGRSLANQGPTSLVIIAFAVLCGTWVHRIIDQSSERAALVEELASTRSELAEASQQAGAAAERERLASEIHDAVAQGLSSIVMLVQATGSTLDRLTELPASQEETVDRARSQLDLVARTARESLAEAGALVEALRPAALDTDSLSEALRRLTARTAEGTGLDTSFALHGAPEALPVAVEVVLLRAAQEALANVRKHAQATAAHVTLSYTEASVSVRVEDDGKGLGLPSATASPGGYGLAAMSRRVEQVGGSRQLRSAPGTGTILQVEVPR